ncbi:hypothetical protein F2P81_021028 [Scophthalmus maximus]|uniref:Uncharacterized protein n=1 Tax=Scophthalmus maximus TaxID=52904 RepID=A0A6A4S581_SCOMX|nr:hypothetical protein F2P81_021028 [Scophthalmus maximus]
MRFSRVCTACSGLKLERFEVRCCINYNIYAQLHIVFGFAPFVIIIDSPITQFFVRTAGSSGAGPVCHGPVDTKLTSPSWIYHHMVYCHTSVLQKNTVCTTAIAVSSVLERVTVLSSQKLTWQQPPYWCQYRHW